MCLFPILLYYGLLVNSYLEENRMQKIRTRLLVIRRRFANFANTAVIVLAIFVVSLAAIETRTQDFTVDDGKFYLLDGRYLLSHLLIAFFANCFASYAALFFAKAEAAGIHVQPRRPDRPFEPDSL